MLFHFFTFFAKNKRQAEASNKQFFRTLKRFSVIPLFLFCIISFSGFSQTLISGSTGNGDFETISPSDAPIQSDIRRAANTNTTFSVPSWTIIHKAGYVGVDAARGGSNGQSYAFVNSSSHAIFISDTIHDLNITRGQGLKLSLMATDMGADRMAYYTVSFIIDGEELKLPQQAVNISQEHVYQQIEFDLQLRLDVSSVAVKIELLNRGNDTNGQQPRFDDVILEIRPATDYPPLSEQDQYFVSVEGDDNNDGSIENPFRTIQKAADVVKYGGIIEIREGTYREKVIIKSSGLKNAPITFRAYNNEKVIVSTCDTLSNWTAVSGDINQDGNPDSDIWQTTMNWNAGENSSDYDQGRWTLPRNAVANNTMFVDDTLRYVAREKAEENPVYLDNWGLIPHRALKHEGFTAPELAGWGDDFWNGAIICHHSSDWSENLSIIGDYSSSDGKVTFENPLTYFPSQKQRFGYYIFGTIKALDKEHEWFKEESSDVIYYKAESGVDPNELTIEMKKRDYTFDLQGANNIIIQNIIHRGGGPASLSYCENFLFQGNEVYGLSENGFGQIKIYGNNVQIRDNYFRQSYKSAMSIGGDRWDIVNNKFENISYRINDTGIDIASNSTRFLISYNTFSGFGRGIFNFYPLQSVISHNHFTKYCRNSWDTAAIDGDKSHGQGGGSLVHHNVFNNAPQYNGYARGEGTNGSGFAGLYSGMELTVYRNIFHNSGRWGLVNSRLNFHNFYHNTFVDVEQKLDISTSLESNYLNNIQVTTDPIACPGFLIKGNADYSDSDFMDIESGDLRLSENSSAIDKGVIIPGINDNFNGSAPDAGALEYGETQWKYGHDFDNPPSISYEYNPPAGVNIIGDGSFTTTAAWDFVQNSSSYNPNSWNHGALGYRGAYSLRLQKEGIIEGEFGKLEANKTYELGIEARLVNQVIRADKYSSVQGTLTTGNHRGENYITGLAEGESVSYNNIDFGDGELYDYAEVSFARQTALSPSQDKLNSLELRLGSPSGELLATLAFRSGVGDSWAWTSSEFESSPSGTQSVYLVPVGDQSEGMRINSIRLFKKNINTEKQLMISIQGHGYPKEINFAGKGDWIDRYEKMLFQSNDSASNLKLEFKNFGPYDIYISRIFLQEIDGYKNIATKGFSSQSSTTSGNVSDNAHDGMRDQASAKTEKETAANWILELSEDSKLQALRISSATDENLKNIRINLSTSDPRLGGAPLLSRDYKLEDEEIGEGKSLYVCILEWMEEELKNKDIAEIKYVQLERFDEEALCLSEVEAIVFDTDVDKFADEVKNEEQWKFTFNYDINPTQLIVQNSDSCDIEKMRIVVRDKAGTSLWQKEYDDSFRITKNNNYVIPGNEISEDGETRLASVLGRSVSIENVDHKLKLDDFKIFDGSQVHPEGNLALYGIASQISNHYKDHDYADEAINGYLFPNNDFTTTSKTANPWWELKLAQTADIDQIVLWNRNPADAASRIGNFTVSVYDEDKVKIWSKNYSYSSGDMAAGKSLTINTDHEDARYIRVQCNSNNTFLHLAEAQVWPKPEESLVRTSPTQYRYYFDLGPVNQVVEDGWTAINPLTNGDVWWGSQPNGLDRGNVGSNDALNRDFATSSKPTNLNIRLANDDWRVSVTTGDAQNSKEGFHLIAEDVVIADAVSSSTNSFSSFTEVVTVNDGVLNLSVSSVSNSDLSWVWNRLSIESNTTKVEHSSSKDITCILYPNPASEEVHILLKDLKGERIDILNNLGQIVKQYPALKNNNSYSLNGLQSGIYYVKIYANKETVIKKLMISK